MEISRLSRKFDHTSKPRKRLTPNDEAFTSQLNMLIQRNQSQQGSVRRQHRWTNFGQLSGVASDCVTPRWAKAVWRLGVWREVGCESQARQDHQGYADKSECRHHRPGVVDRRNQTGA